MSNREREEQDRPAAKQRRVERARVHTSGTGLQIERLPPLSSLLSGTPSHPQADQGHNSITSLLFQPEAGLLDLQPDLGRSSGASHHPQAQASNDTEPVAGNPDGDSNDAEQDAGPTISRMNLESNDGQLNSIEIRKLMTLYVKRELKDIGGKRILSKSAIGTLKSILSDYEGTSSLNEFAATIAQSVKKTSKHQDGWKAWKNSFGSHGFKLSKKREMPARTQPDFVDYDRQLCDTYIAKLAAELKLQVTESIKASLNPEAEEFSLVSCISNLQEKSNYLKFTEALQMYLIGIFYFGLYHSLGQEEDVDSQNALKNRVISTLNNVYPGFHKRNRPLKQHSLRWFYLVKYLGPNMLFFADLIKFRNIITLPSADFQRFAESIPDILKCEMILTQQNDRDLSMIWQKVVKCHQKYLKKDYAMEEFTVFTNAEVLVLYKWEKTKQDIIDEDNMVE